MEPFSATQKAGAAVKVVMHCHYVPRSYDSIIINNSEMNS